MCEVNAELLAAAEKCESLLLSHGDPLRGDDWQAMQDIRAAIANARSDTPTARTADAINLVEELTEALADLGNWLAYGLEKPDGEAVTVSDMDRCEEVSSKAGEMVAKGYRFLGVLGSCNFPTQVSSALVHERGKLTTV